MTVDEAWPFLFEGDEDVEDNSIIQCPSCKKPVGLSDWKRTDVWCDDCRDEHAAITCPRCHRLHHHLGYVFKVVNERP